MKDWKLNLLLFVDPTYTVTVYYDDGITSASASPASGAEETEVTLTVTPKTGYEIAGYEVIAGGVTVDPATKKFDIGEANVVIRVLSKANNKYIVTEECKACLNGGAWTVLHKNTVLQLTPNGAIKGVDVESGGASVTVDAAIQNLIDIGVLVKI